MVCQDPSRSDHAALGWRKRQAVEHNGHSPLARDPGCGSPRGTSRGGRGKRTYELKLGHVWFASEMEEKSATGWVAGHLSNSTRPITNMGIGVLLRLGIAGRGIG